VRTLLDVAVFGEILHANPYIYYWLPTVLTVQSSLKKKKERKKERKNKKNTFEITRFTSIPRLSKSHTALASGS